MDDGEDFVIFCDLLRKLELYVSVFATTSLGNESSRPELINILHCSIAGVPEAFT